MFVMIKEILEYVRLQRRAFSSAAARSRDTTARYLCAWWKAESTL